MLADLRFRLRALFQRPSMERDLDDELRFHIEAETEKHVAAGLPRSEAERRARAAFGGVERIKDDARDARGVALIDSLRQDLRYAWRGVTSQRAFSAAIVLTLALCIGANTTMFGVVDRLLVRPPAYLLAPDRVNRVYISWVEDGRPHTEATFEYLRYRDLTTSTSSFDRTGAVAYRVVAVGTGDDAREMLVGAMSGSMFGFFGAQPAIGRFYTEDEDQPPMGASVAVIGYELWQSRYGGRLDVLGEPMRIGTTTYAIIGVAPRGFVGPAPDSRGQPAAFIPLTAFAAANNASYSRSYSWGWLQMFARRKAGVGQDAANADLTLAARRSWDAEAAQHAMPPADSARPSASVGPVQLSRGPLANQDARVVTWVMGVAIIVLLIACANVANLLLARSIRRRREFALRLALGVTRARLAQQILMESLVLAALGGALGIAAAQWGGGVLRSLFLSEADAAAVATDARTLGFAVLATLAVALLTGLAPLALATRGDVGAALKAGSREGPHRRSLLRTTLLVAQGALSVVLLVGAGLFVRSLEHVRDFRLGYDIDPVVYVEPNMRGARLTPAEGQALSERIEAAVAALPGVVSTTPAVSVPFWSNEGRGTPTVPGVDSVARLGRFLVQTGSPAYFETMGTRILRGRGFTEDDRAEGPRVVVVTESMARVLWPATDALGQLIRIGGDTVPFSTVVGIAEDMRAREIVGDPEFWYYMPLSQYGEPAPELFVRVGGDAEAFTETIRRRAQAEMPADAYVTVRPLTSLVAPVERAWRFGATMFIAFAGVAVVLAAIGLYSVIAYAVAQRRHELGVRIALGAGTGDVLGMILSQGLAFAAAGVGIGGALALAGARWLQPLLFEQSARDPWVYLAVAAGLVIVAVAATLRPALTASRVNPAIALRSE